MKVTYFLGMEPNKESIAFNIWYTTGSRMNYSVFRSAKTEGIVVIALTMQEGDYNEILIADRIVKSTNCQVTMKEHKG